MRRFTSVLLSILLGAIAVGVGMGYFLMKANTDRERLAMIASKAEQDSRDAQRAKEEAIRAANSKLDTANGEITKAQDLIRALNEERSLIASATVLSVPTGREVKGWKEVVSLGQKATVNYPPTYIVAENDMASLILERPSSTVSNGTDPRWFSLMPYDGAKESELLSAFVTSTPVSYLIDGRLLLGQKGVLPGQKDPVLVLKVRGGGLTTHLLWARDPLGKADGSTLFTALATLDFAD